MSVYTSKAAIFNSLFCSIASCYSKRKGVGTILITFGNWRMMWWMGIWWRHESNVSMRNSSCNMYGTILTLPYQVPYTAGKHQIIYWWPPFALTAAMIRLLHAIPTNVQPWDRPAIISRLKQIYKRILHFIFFIFCYLTNRRRKAPSLSTTEDGTMVLAYCRIHQLKGALKL